METETSRNNKKKTKKNAYNEGSWNTKETCCHFSPPRITTYYWCLKSMNNDFDSY